MHSLAEQNKARAPGWKWHLFSLAVLAAIAVVTYLPFANLAPLPDDYGHVAFAERYGMPSGWKDLAREPLSRCRATAILTTAATMELFGFSIAAFNWTGILLHVVNVWLLYGMGVCRWVGWPAAGAAAFVFAARERHHEAVIWYASLHELLVFAFVLLALLAWTRWLEGQSGAWLGVVGIAWLLALASKESGAALMFLLPLVAWLYPGRRRAAVVSFSLGAALTAIYFVLAYSQRGEHLHFHDGTFELGFHAVPNFLRSAWRGLWFWGILALGVLGCLRREAPGKLAAVSILWYGCALSPYVFLTYMGQIPSRHHYLASAGASLLIAAALAPLLRKARRPGLAAGALAAVFLLHNWAYLWTYKLPHMRERAAILEGLVAMFEDGKREPVMIRCPLAPIWEARWALQYRLGLPADGLVVEMRPGWEGRVYDCEEGAWRKEVSGIFRPKH